MSESASRVEWTLFDSKTRELRIKKPPNRGKGFYDMMYQLSLDTPSMLSSGSQIRLSKSERSQLERLTGSDASHITDTKKLNDFINAHLVNYPGRTAEELTLRKILQSFLP